MSADRIGLCIAKGCNFGEEALRGLGCAPEKVQITADRVTEIHTPSEHAFGSRERLLRQGLAIDRLACEALLRLRLRP